MTRTEEVDVTIEERSERRERDKDTHYCDELRVCRELELEADRSICPGKVLLSDSPRFDVIWQG